MNNWYKYFQSTLLSPPIKPPFIDDSSNGDEGDYWGGNEKIIHIILLSIVNFFDKLKLDRKVIENVMYNIDDIDISLNQCHNLKLNYPPIILENSAISSLSPVARWQDNGDLLITASLNMNCDLLNFNFQIQKKELGYNILNLIKSKYQSQLWEIIKKSLIKNKVFNQFQGDISTLLNIPRIMDFIVDKGSEFFITSPIYSNNLNIRAYEIFKDNKNLFKIILKNKLPEYKQQIDKESNNYLNHLRSLRKSFPNKFLNYNLEKNVNISDFDFDNLEIKLSDTYPKENNNSISASINYDDNKLIISYIFDIILPQSENIKNELSVSEQGLDLWQRGGFKH